MTFDIVSFTQEEISKLNSIQMQLLRTAQKKKNELEHKMQSELAMFKRLVMTNGMANSTLYEHKKEELAEEFDYQVEIIREQLIYSLELNEPIPDGEGDSESAGYIVDYSLSYIDRYAIVREYYMSIPDPAERVNLYLSDNIARNYLGSYYTTLLNVLYVYSQ